MKIKMLVERKEMIEVVVDSEDFNLDISSLQAKFEFIEEVKGDFATIAEDDTVGRAEALVEHILKDFKVEE